MRLRLAAFVMLPLTIAMGCGTEQAESPTGQSPPLVNPPPSGERPGRACGEVDYLGYCRGTTVVFCHNGALTEYECGAQGCGWIDDETGHYCGGGDAPPAPMGPPEADPEENGLFPPPAPDKPEEDDPPVGPSPEPEPEPDPDPLPDPAPEPEPDPGPDPEPDPVPEPEPWPEDPPPDPDPNPQPEPDPDPAPDPAPDPDRDPPPDPLPDPDRDPPPDPIPDPMGDDCYFEPYDADANVANAEAMMRNNPQGAASAFIEARWPGGMGLIRTRQTFFEILSTNSWSNFLDSLATVMHENTHGFHADNALWQQRATFYIRDDIRLQANWVQTPARSAIRQRLPDDSADLYARTYLTGEQGQRGFFEVMEEWECYIHDLATYSVAADGIQAFGFSGRDGAVAFAWFLTHYLRLLRTEHNQTWEALRAQANIREAIKLDWLKMHFWLIESDQHPSHGINDGRIRAHLYQADNLRELELFLGFAVTDSHCLP